MPAASLYDMAKRQTLRNIDRLDDVGDLPYSFMRPILIRIENPAQLATIEAASPQICGEDAEVWLSFIKRDITNWESKPHEPRNPNSWGKVYRKLKREQDENDAKEGERLKELFKGKKRAREESKSEIDPRAWRGEKIARPQSTTHARSKPDDSALRFTGGSRTKVMSGKDVMLKVRREMAETKAQKGRVLNTPTHLLKQRASKVTMAPQSMVQAKMREPQAQAPSGKHAPSRTPFASGARNANPTAGADMAAREQRLRALTSGATQTKAPLPSERVSLPTNAIFRAPKLGMSKMKRPSPESTPPAKRKKTASLMPTPNSTRTGC